MPATYKKIGEFLKDDAPWDSGVKSLIKWQFGLHGDFNTALWNAIKTADETNLERLGRGFPLEASAFNRWRMEGLAQELRKAGLDI
jgi:hypothetical protein